MCAGRLTKTRSLEEIWVDFWVRGSKMQKVGYLQKVYFKFIRKLLV